MRDILIAAGEPRGDRNPVSFAEKKKKKDLLGGRRREYKGPAHGDRGGLSLVWLYLLLKNPAGIVVHGASTKTTKTLRKDK